MQESTSFLNPERIVNLLNLREGMQVAEFGSGSGFFSLAAARKIGREGRVYAIDVQKETLEALRSRSRLEGVFNVEILWADLEKAGSTKLPDATLDLVLVPNMLFQSNRKEDVLREARRILKPGGELLIVDWIPERALYGKQMGHLVSQDAMRQIAEGVGFTFVEAIDVGSASHYGLLFRR